MMFGWLKKDRQQFIDIATEWQKSVNREHDEGVERQTRQRELHAKIAECWSHPGHKGKKPEVVASEIAKAIRECEIIVF